MAFYGLQMTHTGPGSISGTSGGSSASDRRIQFDDTIIVPEDVIKCERGLFTIYSSGNYLINWSVTLKTGLGQDGAFFTLQENHYLATAPTEELPGGKSYPSTLSVKTGQLTGTAILTIPDKQIVKFGIYNSGENDAIFATSSDGTELTNANITIIPYVTGSYSSSYGLIGATFILDDTAVSPILPANGTVKFNTVINKYEDIFSYDAATGSITSKVSGNYSLEWTVNLAGSEDVDSICFEIRKGETVLGYSESVLLMQNVYSGSAFISLNAGESFNLVNASKSNMTSSSVTYAAIKTKAKLLILGHS